MLRRINCSLFFQKYNLSWVTPDPDNWSVRDTDGSDVTNLPDLIYEKRFQSAKDRVETYAEKARAEGRPGYSLRSALGWVNICTSF